VPAPKSPSPRVGQNRIYIYIYKCTVHDRTLSDFPAKNTVTIGLARTVYICTVHDRTLSDFPAKKTVCTPFIYGYLFMVLDNPILVAYL
jgi:hypothetical protein